jgi:uncharacterized protein DUF5343
VLGEALRDAYEDLFHINEHPSEKDRTAIEGRFKSVHNATDPIAARQAATFFAFLKLADITGKHTPKKQIEKPVDEEKKIPPPFAPKLETQFSGLRYNIEIHLPATKDVEVYNAIFKSLREHLLND